jgi:Rrf2 family iron-sulfur cluster assembly transcriptional regulator
MILTAIARYAIIAIIDLAEHQNKKEKIIKQQSPINKNAKKLITKNQELIENLTLNKIANNNNIPLSCLEQIFSKLKKANIVKSIKGPGGGYIFTKNLNQIKLSCIIEAVGEKIKITRCNNAKSCQSHNFIDDEKNKTNKKLGLNQENNSKNKCKTHNLWHILEQGIFNYFASISLLEICNSAESNNKNNHNQPLLINNLQNNLIKSFNSPNIYNQKEAEKEVQCDRK